MLFEFPFGFLEILLVDVANCLLNDPRTDWEWDFDRDLGGIACLGMLDEGKIEE